MKSDENMNVAIVGYGKMGHEIERILAARGHNIAMIIDENNIAEFTAESLKHNKIDVAVEFSTPHSAFDNIVKCLEAGVAVVCGTTAWLDRYCEVEKICKECQGAFFYTSNYSIGVNIMFKVNQKLAQMMNAFPQYDVTVEEVHHTQKKDAPSGTAITIAEEIIANMDRKTKWVGQTTTTPEELEVVSVRRSVVPGIHTVTYESDADLISISHNAKSRAGFAMGASLAAEYIYGKKGVFSMSDMLGF